MGDIKDQLIKDSYNYVLQSDLGTGVVYRIGGDIPVNPIFQSGLTINSGFTYSNGTEQLGYVMTCDAFGNATWEPISATTPSSGVTSVTTGSGLSGNVTTGAVTIVNTAPDRTVTISGGTGITTGGTYPNFTIVNSEPDQTVTITGGTDIQITGTYPDFGISFTGSTTGGTVSGDYLPLSGGTVTGGTVFQSGLTANTFSANTYQNLPSFNSVQINGSTQFSGDTNNFINFSGINITITSAATNTLVFSAATGGGGGVTSVTAGSGIDINQSTGNVIITNGIGVAMLTSDQTTNISGLTSINDLSFSVISGSTYRFRFVIHYEAFNLSTGSRFTISGAATSILSYRSMYSLGTGTQTLNPALSAYDSPAIHNLNSSATAGNIAIVEGILRPSENGSVVARFASEASVGSAFIRAKEGSYVEYQKIA